MTQSPVNLINEMDLTNYVNAITWGVERPKAISPSDFKNKDYIIQNKTMIATMVLDSYIRSHIRRVINAYVDTDFLSPVLYNEDLSDPIKESMKAGCKAYQIHIDKAPAELHTDLIKAKASVMPKIMMQMNQSIMSAKEGDFVINLKVLRNALPELTTLLKQLHWNEGSLNIKKLPEIDQDAPIQMPDHQND